MMIKLPLFVRLASVLLVLGVVGCQQPHSARQSKSVPLNDQVEQLASVVAGTKYLKYKCNRSDLPADAVINRVANKVAKQRGWDPAAYAALPQRSEAIYQSLTRDSTPEQTKCSSFNGLLAPFTDELRKEGR
ncbi:type II secretion system pilot lipoprotein GspS [Serratia aquatilis]|uniref:Type II secretion system pilot lipoprotein GspS n=1 Tax=Serratia aquatilis TaxID=1737515 RepID=A0ABV6EI08_9GAMM